MNLERWAKIEEIFQAALDIEDGEREEFIRDECAGNADLRREVEKLVARYEREETFLESPVWTDSRILQSNARREIIRSLDDEILPECGQKSFIGKRVGVYRLTKELGRGGMGVVYLAERADGEFAQKVAVKLVKRGMDTDFVLKRFRVERQILANLNHPNIAHLLDGGTTEDDSPYFIMEYIEGEPFLKYCRENELDLRRKLELFLQICRAVTYAHRKKIVHRDIKPSNVLVTNEGEPKLLDFGIAKILDQDSIHESAMLTATAMRLMTPEYASPEQARGDVITTASDQYSLGVLLYEMITGARPYKFTSRAPHEIARVICEELPIEPSSGEFAKVFTENGDAQSNEDFCKKLDCIVLKTLRKNPAQRYASVEELAADIERFLRAETVCAESFDRSEMKSENPPLVPLEENERASDAPVRAGKISIAHSIVGEPNSPRREGLKQGIFLTALFVVGIPFFNIIIKAAIVPPPLMTVIFLLIFFGGLSRILYALLLENARFLPIKHATSKKRNAEAETNSLKSSPPR